MIVDKIALILVIVGALNWGGVGLFGFDTVAFLFGGQAAVLSRIVYALVGLAGLWRVAGVVLRVPEQQRDAPETCQPFNKKEHLTVLFFPVIFRFADASPSPLPG